MSRNQIQVEVKNRAQDEAFVDSFMAEFCTLGSINLLGSVFTIDQVTPDGSGNWIDSCVRFAEKTGAEFNVSWIPEHNAFTQFQSWHVTPSGIFSYAKGL